MSIAFVESTTYNPQSAIRNPQSAMAILDFNFWNFIFLND